MSVFVVFKVVPLLALLTLAQPLAAQSAQAADGDGEAVYKKHCLVCHQADGGGVPNMQPSLLTSEMVKGDPQDLAFFILTGTAEGDGTGDYDNAMPSFPMLSDEEVAALLTYVRRAFGGLDDSVEIQDVADVRKAIAP